MLSPPLRAKKLDSAAALILLGWFALLGALLFTADGAWRTFRLQVESTRWPAVSAKIQECHIHTWYGSLRGRASSFHYIVCEFSYDFTGHSYAVRKQVGAQLSIVNGSTPFPQPKVTLGTLRNWISSHPQGSILSAHCDPSDPGRISLAGADDDLQLSTAAGQLQIAGIFSITALVSLLAGLLLRNKKERLAAAASASTR
jgi:hypothetical protein